jgi:hypothetical protein
MRRGPARRELRSKIDRDFQDIVPRTLSRNTPGNTPFPTCPTRAAKIDRELHGNPMRVSPQFPRDKAKSDVADLIAKGVEFCNARYANCRGGNSPTAKGSYWQKLRLHLALASDCLFQAREAKPL